MILLLGSGYIGSAFAAEMNRREIPWLPWLRHNPPTPGLLRRAGLVINCAAFVPKPSVSLCDQHPEETIRGNLMLPMRLAEECAMHNIPLAHISTGCLWNDGLEHTEDDLSQRAFTGHCGFYVGTKVMAEQEVSKYPRHYIWRVRLPFDEIDNERNYLSKLATLEEVWDHTNSISHRGDFAKACLDLCQEGAPLGTYNMTNPGSVRAVEIVERLMELGIRKTMPRIVTDKPGDCRLNTDKLLATGVKMRSAEEAVEDSLKNWKANV